MRRIFARRKTEYLAAGAPLTCVLYLLVCVQPRHLMAAKPAPVFSEETQLAAELKSKAEELGSAIKRSHQERKISDKHYTRVRLLYIDAKAAFDGWATALQTELESVGDIQQSDHYKTSLNRAATKAEKFISYAEGLFIDRPRAGPGVAEIVKILANTGIEMWKEFRAGDQRRRDALIKRLDSLKWKSFDAT